MKKVLLISVSALLLLNSCGTYTADGAVTGGWFGSVIGSAIGGISGGHRGSNIGSLIGMAGGAVIGAAVGQAADQAEQRKYEDYKMSRQRTNSNRNNDYSYQDNSGYDASNSGDDRLYGFGEDFTPSNNVLEGGLEIRADTQLNILIESIAPGKGVRYTASIKGDNGLRDGEAVIRIGVLQANKEVSSQTRNFTIVTRKK